MVRYVIARILVSELIAPSGRDPRFVYKAVGALAPVKVLALGSVMARRGIGLGYNGGTVEIMLVLVLN